MVLFLFGFICGFLVGVVCCAVANNKSEEIAIATGKITLCKRWFTLTEVKGEKPKMQPSETVRAVFCDYCEDQDCHGCEIYESGRGSNGNGT